MATSGLWDWVRGYVIIRVTGRMIEKFVNMAAARHIGLYDVTTLGPGMITARVSVDDYRRLHPILRDCQCRATVDARVGAPFLIAALGRRKFLFIGLMLFVAILYVMSSILWTIEVVGANPHQEQQIRRILDDMGVNRWTLLSSIDCDTIRSEITKSVEGLAWAGVETQGTALIVRVAEKILPDAPVFPIDLIASEDAIVVKLIVLAGDACVAEGQTVVAGQVLVSGKSASGAGGDAAHARAIVEGRVWREGRAVVPLNVEERVRTGRKSIHYRVLWGNLDFRLGRVGSFEAFDTKEYRRDYRPGVEFIRIERYELALTSTRISRSEAYALARAAAEDSIAAKLNKDARIVSVSERVSDENVMPEAVEVILTVETVEDIARPRERQ
ncbi:MAG: sporulation protein YqfD [Bacillota bacterium]|nr:sporulation protein YqfD [Bacillota bacterium]